MDVSQHLPRRDHAEDDASDHRQYQSRSENREVNGDRFRAGEARRIDGWQDLDTPPGEENTDRGADHGKHHALGEKLAHQPASPCAEGRPDCHLALAPFPPREQQVRHVATRDEQDQAHRAEQQE